MVKYLFKILTIAIWVISAPLLAQTSLNVDTLPKFLIENYEIQDEIARVTGKKGTQRQSIGTGLTKEELINRYKKSITSRIKQSAKLTGFDPSYFYFTSAIENDQSATSQIVSLGYPHQVKRGLNILRRMHGQYVVLNYDLYADPSLKESLLATLKELSEQKLFFAMIVDRNFEFSAQEDKNIVRNLGLVKLANLSAGQAYVGYNHRGFVNETSSDNTLALSYLKEISEIIQPQKEIEKNTKEVNRYIAHAGGKVDGYIYTNSLNAMDSSYKKGFRLFELDICETSDSVFVATHDWDTWAKQTGFQGSLPPTLAEYNSHKIWGKFDPMDITAINEWFIAHPDAILVSDKVNEPTRFSSKFIDKSRLMMELFTLDAVKEGLTLGMKSAMPSEVVIGEVDGNLQLFIDLGVKNIAMSRWSIIDENHLFLNGLKANNILVYVYLIYDETLEVTNKMFYIYGLYADKWDYLNN